MDDSLDVNIKSSRKGLGKEKVPVNKAVNKSDLVSSNRNYYVKPFLSNKEIPRPVIHSSSTINPSTNNFQSILASHVSLSEVKKFLSRAEVPRSLGLIRSIAKHICFECNMIRGLVRLSCSHSVCIGCYKKSLIDFEVNKNLSTFKAIRCNQCKFLPIRIEIFHFLDEDTARTNEFMNISVIKRCCWCNRYLNLMTEYLPELECLDLCRECYADQLFLKANTCMACKAPFRNVNHTLQRRSVCCICSSVSFIVNTAMRSYYNNKVICYDCHKSIVEEEKWDKAFGDLKINQGKSILGYYYNKTCPVCTTDKPLSELCICKKCGNFKCDDCQSEDLTCYFCAVQGNMQI